MKKMFVHLLDSKVKKDVVKLSRINGLLAGRVVGLFLFARTFRPTKPVTAPGALTYRVDHADDRRSVCERWYRLVNFAGAATATMRDNGPWSRRLLADRAKQLVTRRWPKQDLSDADRGAEQIVGRLDFLCCAEITGERTISHDGFGVVAPYPVRFSLHDLCREDRKCLLPSAETVQFAPKLLAGNLSTIDLQHQVYEADDFFVVDFVHSKPPKYTFFQSAHLFNQSQRFLTTMALLRVLSHPSRLNAQSQSRTARIPKLFVQRDIGIFRRMRMRKIFVHLLDSKVKKILSTFRR
jgi:hypothetical protein